MTNLAGASRPKAARQPMRTLPLAATVALVFVLTLATLMPLVSLIGGPSEWIVGGLLAIVGCGFAVALAIRHRALKLFESDVRDER